MARDSSRLRNFSSVVRAFRDQRSFDECRDAGVAEVKESADVHRSRNFRSIAQKFVIG